MKSFPFFSKAAPNVVPVEEKNQDEFDKEAGVNVNNTDSEPHNAAVANINFEGLTPEFQRGIQKMQATTQVWSTSHLVFAYIK